MRIQVSALFLTFVLFVSIEIAAAPNTPDPDFNENQTDKASDAVDPTRSELIDISRPSGSFNPHATSEYFFAYPRSMSPRLGALVDSTSKTSGLLYLVGFQFLTRTPSLKYYEYGVDAFSDGNGAFHVQERWIQSRGRVRPYSKAGFGLKFVAADGLATFVNLTYYQVRGAYGCEWLIAPPLSFRAEAEATFSLQGLSVNATAGYSWAW